MMKVVGLMKTSLVIINYNDYEIINRNIIMTEDTKKRYNMLKSKLEELK